MCGANMMKLTTTSNRAVWMEGHIIAMYTAVDSESEIGL